jgi:hypothetical protein
MKPALAALGLALAAALAGCTNAQKLLQPVDDARKAVQARFGDDWNITLPIVNGSGDSAVVCGYTEAPHAAKPGASPALTDDRLFIWADKQLTLSTDIGTRAMGDRVDKDCPGLIRVKTVEPRQFNDLAR